jgi:hypothetical protein
LLPDSRPHVKRHCLLTWQAISGRFAWWIRVWRWIGWFIVHQIRHGARIHHKLPPTRRTTGYARIFHYIGTRGERMSTPSCGPGGGQRASGVPPARGPLGRPPRSLAADAARQGCPQSRPQPHMMVRPQRNRSYRLDRPWSIRTFYLVGVGRFELPASSSRTKEKPQRAGYKIHLTCENILPGAYWRMGFRTTPGARMAHERFAFPATRSNRSHPSAPGGPGHE